MADSPSTGWGSMKRASTGGLTTVPAGSDAQGALDALYVTGPRGGGRHLLFEGILSIGRASGSGLVLDEPKVSRLHAAVEVGDTITLTDLDSANGTFYRGARLTPHQPYPLELERPFFIGDSTLLVRRTALARGCAQRVASLEALPGHLSAAGRSGAGLVITTVRCDRSSRRGAWEAILGGTLTSPADWLLWLDRGHLVLGTAGGGDGDAAAFAAIVSRDLTSWGLTPDVQARFVSQAQLAAGEGDLRRVLDPATTMTLLRGPVILEHPSMTAIKATVTRVAPATVNVLVLGETGVGKDVVASMVHELSARAAGPFVRLNCATIPESLLESELFGHEQGAFTGAAGAKQGLIEAAHGGTVFLDEIGDLPLPLQAKLLRAIESREVLRLGGLRARTVDVRFVAATNRPLEREVEAGRFRRDLFYRLNTVTITVPPLRERRSEIGPLARLFLQQACLSFGLPARELTAAAVVAISAHAWPGNVRELRNAMERAALLSSRPEIDACDLDQASPAAAHLVASPGNERAEAADERARIEQALRASGGNQSRAATLLGLPRRTLVRRIARLGLPRPRIVPAD